MIDFVASSNYISVNKVLAKKFGINEAIILGELASEYDYWNGREELQDGFFYSTVDNISKNTTIGEKQQRLAINNLVSAGVIEVKKMGLPAKRYFKINEIKLMEVICCCDFEQNKFLPNGGTCNSQMAELDTPNGRTNKNNIITITNNNKEYIKEESIKKKKCYSDDEMLNQAILDFIEYRKGIKSPMTDKGIKLLINKLNELSSNSNEQIEILNQSIVNGWKGVFPLNADKKNGKKEDREYMRNDYSNDPLPF